jgi:hypothetical protein
MPVPISDVDALKTYVQGVMGRAEHHANNVSAIALALAGAIVWRKDADAEIEVMSQDGDLKNVLWLIIGGHRFAFSYNHTAKEIEMRENTTRGAVLHRFSNATPIHNVERIFRQL